MDEIQSVPSEETISQNFMFVRNLYNAAIFHKKHCAESDCGVSLYVLKITAIRIWKIQEMFGFTSIEDNEVKRMLDEWPIL